ncbi:hypothetical protein CY34DRAFT_798804 [Suillus luteus UH-Slu-Lm8-n1]|uniref:Uncharacterized protein n=1 Tax=Suillus luteus UH-Slu-Lm8-n1 TaxID=930992 RepID=A0A0D0BDR2_9AGAM|nr:hypothetical protein CY34DRAFT_798804 [Suillus luteus UH-Slu-Lm8-n1]
MLTSQHEETFLTTFQAISTRLPSGHAEIAPYIFNYLGSHSSMHPRLSVITQNLAPSFMYEVAGNRRRSDILLGRARQPINHDTDAPPHTSFGLENRARTYARSRRWHGFQSL